MITELVGSYNLILVTTSYLVAVAASFAALSLAGRVAVSHGLGKVVWLAAGSMAMGSGIWSMHFVGMLAFSLPIPMKYNLPVVMLSVIPAVAASALALTVTSRKRLTAHALMIGGVLMGTAIAAMHYTGMAAMVTAASLSYDPTLFLASIVIAMGASFAALWIAFRLRDGARALVARRCSARHGRRRSRNALHRNGRGQVHASSRRRDPPGRDHSNADLAGLRYCCGSIGDNWYRYLRFYPRRSSPAA